MNEAVRLARGDDAAELEWLQQLARSGIADIRGGAALLEEQPATDWRQPAHLRTTWVAVIDDVVLGYLELRIIGQRASVHQVFVHPEAREVGLGDELLAEATAAAVAAGCTTLEGSALPGDRHTKNLYERAGVTARKIIVSRSLVTQRP